MWQGREKGYGGVLSCVQSKPPPKGKAQGRASEAARQRQQGRRQRGKQASKIKCPNPFSPIECLFVGKKKEIEGEAQKEQREGKVPGKGRVVVESEKCLKEIVHERWRG